MNKIGPNVNLPLPLPYNVFLENIHTPPMEGFFGLDPPIPLDIPLLVHTFL